MERWSGRIALVTGAGAGIGAAVTESLVKHGMTVVGIDLNNYSRIQKMKERIPNLSGKLHALKVDVSKENQVIESFEWISKNLGSVDVLVNCAGVYFPTYLTDINKDYLQKLYDINVIGLSIFTREAIKSMKRKGIDDGHIINMNSITGHFPPVFPETSVYVSTKHAIKVLSEGLRRELVQMKSKIRVTNLSPSCVDTDLARKASLPNYKEMPKLNPKDIADAIIYVLSTPPHVQVHELTIRPVGDDYP